MRIKVKVNDTGSIINIDIKETDTVLRIKEKFDEKYGIPPDQQRLIYGGKVLNNVKTVKDYKLTEGSILNLIVVLRGS